MKSVVKKRLPKMIVKRLPKTFRGAKIVRALGMQSSEVDALLKKKTLDEFDATRDMWIVVADDALRENGEVKGFLSKAPALRYARACGNGNVNHLVLRVTEQIFVLATQNDLGRER